MIALVLFRISLLAALLVALFNTRSRQRIARRWRAWRIDANVPPLFVPVVATFTVIIVAASAAYLLAPQRFHVQQARRGELLRAGDGSEVTISLPRFETAYNAEPAFLAKKIASVIKKHPDVAEPLFKIALRQRPAAYPEMLEKAIDVMPEYAVIFGAEAVGAIAETGLHNTGPRTSADALRIRTAAVQKQIADQIARMMQSDPKFMADHGLIPTNINDYLTGVRAATNDAYAAASRGDIQDAKSLDVVIRKQYTDVFDEEFESDRDHDGVADGWTLDTKPIPRGTSVGLDSRFRHSGNSSQRITIASAGTSARMIAREISLKPGVAYRFSVWTYTDMKAKYSIRVGYELGGTECFWTPGLDVTDQWVQASGMFVPQRDKITIYVYENEPGPAPRDFSVWVDDLRLEREAPLIEALKGSHWRPGELYTLAFGTEPADSQFFIIRKKEWPSHVF